MGMLTEQPLATANSATMATLMAALRMDGLDKRMLGGVFMSLPP
jgi:hypothetical protein